MMYEISGVDGKDREGSLSLAGHKLPVAYKFSYAESFDEGEGHGEKSWRICASLRRVSRTMLSQAKFKNFRTASTTRVRSRSSVADVRE